MKRDKDGLARDVEKLGDEAGVLRRALAPELARFSWKKPHKWPHLVTNLAVESCRASPYFMGHAIVLVVGIAALVYVWIVL